MDWLRSVLIEELRDIENTWKDKHLLLRNDILMYLLTKYHAYLYILDLIEGKE